MFSLPKLLILFALLWAVWLAFRLIDRRNQARDDQAESGETPDMDKSVDLTECDQCGAYVPAGGCDKTDCPLNS